MEVLENWQVEILEDWQAEVLEDWQVEVLEDLQAEVLEDLQAELLEDLQSVFSFSCFCGYVTNSNQFLQKARIETVKQQSPLVSLQQLNRHFGSVNFAYKSCIKSSIYIIQLIMTINNKANISRACYQSKYYRFWQLTSRRYTFSCTRRGFCELWIIRCSGYMYTVYRLKTYIVTLPNLYFIYLANLPFSVTIFD